MAGGVPAVLRVAAMGGALRPGAVQADALRRARRRRGEQAETLENEETSDERRDERGR